ncbi:hypothetical protein FQR65_LT17875 [Abscondita terminalis]|nr:hypothetical protein FQR65_LT17875 [Abscondita terminalis]
MKEAGQRRTKTGVMLGLGEERDEVFRTIEDIRNANVDVITLGQYLQPTKRHLPVKRFITPEELMNMEILPETWDSVISRTNSKMIDDNTVGLEERIKQALETWGLLDFTADEPMNRLSGGQKTKVLIAGIEIHQPDIILMDEPTNHLDRQSRQQLYEFIENTNKTLLVVSHDRTLLNLLPKTAELNRTEIVLYGGNYDFYKEQKQIQQNALQNSIKNTENALKKAKATERETLERQQKLDAKGKKKQEKAGVAEDQMGIPCVTNAENQHC